MSTAFLLAERAKVRYEIKVKTSEQKLSGTDSNIYLQMYGARGISDEINLAKGMKGNQFERDNLDTFIIDIPDCGDIYQIHLRSDNKGAAPGWLCSYVTIKRDLARADSTEIPTVKFVNPIDRNQWINKKNPYLTLIATEGYKFENNVPTPSEPIIIYGAIKRVPAGSNMTLTSSLEYTLSVTYTEVDVTDVKVTASAESKLDVSLGSVTTAFETVINNSLKREYGQTYGEKRTATGQMVIDNKDNPKDRVFIELWSQINHIYNITMGSESYHFSIPCSMEFGGYEEIDPDKESAYRKKLEA